MLTTTSPANATRFSWEQGQAEITRPSGRKYGFSSSDTPSIWVAGSGWKPMVWASYHGLSLRSQRALLKELILEDEADTLYI